MVIVPPLGISRWPPEDPPMLKLKKPPPKNELGREGKRKDKDKREREDERDRDQ